MTLCNVLVLLALGAVQQQQQQQVLQQQQQIMQQQQRQASQVLGQTTAQQQAQRAKSAAAHAKLRVIQRQLASVQSTLQSDVNDLFNLGKQQDEKENQEALNLGIKIPPSSLLETGSKSNAQEQLRLIQQQLQHVNAKMQADMADLTSMDIPSSMGEVSEAEAKVARLQKQLKESSAKMEAVLGDALNMRHDGPSSLAQTGYSAVVPKGLEAASDKLHRLEEELRRQDQEYQQETAADQNAYPDVARALESSFADTTAPHKHKHEHEHEHVHTYKHYQKDAATLAKEKVIKDGLEAATQRLKAQTAHTEEMMKRAAKSQAEWRRKHQAGEDSLLETGHRPTDDEEHNKVEAAIQAAHKREQQWEQKMDADLKNNEAAFQEKLHKKVEDVDDQ